MINGWDMRTIPYIEDLVSSCFIQRMEKKFDFIFLSHRFAPYDNEIRVA